MGESMSVPKPALGLRLKAMTIHAALSLAVAAAAAALVFLVWYPGDLAFLLRGAELFFLLTGCDVVLGPVLSFIVCSPNKRLRSLVFDYSVIAAVQLAALVYGMQAVADARPAFLVLASDRFELANAGEVGRTDPRDVEALQRMPVGWTGYRMAVLQMPTTTEGRNEALKLELDGVEMHTLPRYLGPYDASLAAQRAQPLEVLEQRHPEATASVERILNKAGVPREQAVWLPLRTRYGFHTVVLTKDARVIGFAEPDPY